MEEIAWEYVPVIVRELVIEENLKMSKKFFENGVDYELVKSVFKYVPEEKLREIYESVKGTA